ncbi:hypothetical protein Bca52824_046080 [Brassica carinata]|uniref:Uncharacterized protein n=1 Tax=Brassica carinata TaxID=52824 RepID=A0A8X7US45_BRACI|nr:hypothetical protein Bca52824_046080 [Brassica carinata]
MVHAESVKLSSLSNGHVPQEKLGGDVLQNSTNVRVTASTKTLKFKRRKARMAENVNVVGADDHHPSVPSSEANMNVANADDPCKEEKVSTASA